MPYAKPLQAFYTQLGARLRIAREQRAMSMSDLAAALSPVVAVSTVSSWETGARRLPADRIPELCRKLRCSPTWLMGMPPESSSEDRELLRGALRAASGTES